MLLSVHVTSFLLPWLWASIGVTCSYSSRLFLCTLAEFIHAHNYILDYYTFFVLSPFLCCTFLISIASSLAQAPSLQQLLNFKSKTTHINVVEQIGTHYSSLGPFLLNDNTGAITKAIESQYKLDAFSINHEILSRWLQGKGKTPVSWRTLIDTLKTIKLSTLAENIESCF